jgi:hypothetical protein
LSTFELAILLVIGFIAVILVRNARRFGLSRPQVAFLLAVTGVGVVGGLAVVNGLPGQPVALLTDADDAMHGGCFLSFIEGEFVTDPVSGTAIIGRNGGSTDERFPVMWPLGWTGRRTLFSDVEVLDPTGKVVVRTGTRVHLMGGGFGPSGRPWLTCDAAYQLP